MKKLEPLLKDEVETFPFLENNKKSIKKDKTLILTIILAIIVVAFVGNSLYPFYIGFKYYDLRFEKLEEEPVQNEGEEVLLTSSILTDTYKKFDANSNNILSDTLKGLYTGAKVDVNSMALKDKFALIVSNLGLNCQNTQIKVTKEDLKNMANTLFNNSNIINWEKPEEIENFIINYDSSTNSYTITKDSCVADNNFVAKSIFKATSKDDELYVYERFGYFVHEQGKRYNVYGNALASGSVITSFTDEQGKKEFSTPEILKTYKWTYKKNQDNNYYLVSINPE